MKKYINKIIIAIVILKFNFSFAVENKYKINNPIKIKLSISLN
jgi:hypothetical protein